MPEAEANGVRCGRVISASVSSRNVKKKRKEKKEKPPLFFCFFGFSGGRDPRRCPIAKTKDRPAVGVVTHQLGNPPRNNGVDEERTLFVYCHVARLLSMESDITGKYFQRLSLFYRLSVDSDVDESNIKNLDGSHQFVRSWLVILDDVAQK